MDNPGFHEGAGYKWGVAVDLLGRRSCWPIWGEAEVVWLFQPEVGEIRHSEDSFD